MKSTLHEGPRRVNLADLGMNSAFSAAVKGGASRWWAATTGLCALVMTLGIGGAASCVDVEGGAIELSWTLRTFGGDVIDSDREEACRRARIERVRVCWRRVAGPDAGGGPEAGGDRTCRAARSRTFSCEADRGVTQFEVPPGENSIWIEPLCAGGEPPAEGTYDVPAPIVRAVRGGEVVALSTLLIVATDGDRNCPAAGCTCAE